MNDFSKESQREVDSLRQRQCRRSETDVKDFLLPEKQTKF